VTTIGFRSSNTGAMAGNSATCPLLIPSAVVGDLLVMWGCTAGTSSAFTADNGLGAADYVSDKPNLSMGVWVRAITSGLLGATVTQTNTTPLHRPAAGCLVLSGASAVDAWGPSNGNSASMDCPSITPSHDHEALVTIAAAQAGTARTWTGWAGSTPGPATGNGSVGAGGVETAAFYKLDSGATSGVATGILSQLSSPTTGWVGITLGIRQPGVASVPFSATLSAQAALGDTLGDTRAGSVWNLFYAKPGGSWGVLTPFNARPGGSWN
jgi:hypothetical protein